MFFKILTLFIVILFSTNVYADECADGFRAYAKHDYKLAILKFNIGAKKGNTDCLHGLGIVNYLGEGTIQNYKTAFDFEMKAAIKNAEAQFVVGIMYAEGQGVEKNLLLAHMWSNIAIANGIENAKRLRDSLVNKMTNEEIATAQEMAKECSLKNYNNCN